MYNNFYGCLFTSCSVRGFMSANCCKTRMIEIFLKKVVKIFGGDGGSAYLCTRFWEADEENGS